MRFEEISPDLIENVFSDGLILYKRPDNEPILPAASSGFSPMLLYSFDLTNLQKKEKMQFNRKLYGIKFKKGGKEYDYKGLIDRKGGKKLGSGVIMVPASSENDFDEFFTSQNVSFNKRAVILLAF